MKEKKTKKKGEDESSSSDEDSKGKKPKLNALGLPIEESSSSKKEKKESKKEQKDDSKKAEKEFTHPYAPTVRSKVKTDEGDIYEAYRTEKKPEIITNAEAGTIEACREAEDDFM